MTTKPTLASIKAHNAEKGGYFFSKGATAAFGSKYQPTVYTGNGGTYFVHTDTFTHSDDTTSTSHRIARYDPATGDVRNVSSHASLDDARAEAKRLAKG